MQLLRLCIYRLVLPNSVTEDVNTVVATFKVRNKIKGEVFCQGRDHEAEAKTKHAKTKPSRILILMGDGACMERMVEIAMVAKEKFPGENPMARSCFKVTNAFVSARYNLRRIGQYIKAWKEEKEKSVK